MNFSLALAVLLAQGATPSPAPIAPSAAASGAQELFEQKCKFCHGIDGMGHTKKGKQLKAPDFTSGKWNKETTDGEIVEAIQNGVPKTKMPAFKSKLSEEDIQALAVYVRTFRARKQK